MKYCEGICGAHQCIGNQSAAVKNEEHESIYCSAENAASNFDGLLIQHNYVVPNNVKSVAKFSVLRCYAGDCLRGCCCSFLWERRTAERSALDRDKLHRAEKREDWVRWEC